MQMVLLRAVVLLGPRSNSHHPQGCEAAAQGAGGAGGSHRAHWITPSSTSEPSHTHKAKPCSANLVPSRASSRALCSMVIYPNHQVDT